MAASGLADLDRLVAALRAAQVFPADLAYLVTVAWVGSRRGTVDFDEIGAQVIVILVLALAIDVRFFRLAAGRDRLEDLGEPYEEKGDLPKLYKMTKSLALTPESQMEEQIRRILGGCTSAVEGLGSLRNRSGDAHGRGRTTYRLGTRHASLAVNLAGTAATFLMETFEARTP